MIDLHTTLNALCTQKSMQPILSISIISISHPSLFLTLPRFDFPTKITSTPCFTSYEPYLGYFHHHHFLQLYLTRSQLHSFSLHPTFGSLSLFQRKPKTLPSSSLSSPNSSFQGRIKQGKIVLGSS